MICVIVLKCCVVLSVIKMCVIVYVCCDVFECVCGDVCESVCDVCGVMWVLCLNGGVI